MNPLRAALGCAIGALLAGCVMVVVDPAGLLQPRTTLKEHTLTGKGRDKIVLIAVSGVLSDRPGNAVFGLQRTPSLLARVNAALDKASDDRHVRAVVLRIDSPGGTVAASDEIYARVLDFRQRRKVPVIAALGGVATSGAYYVACAADTIVAQPATITGSIGVVLVSLNLAGLMDKIGIADATYTAGVNKDLLSPLHGATPEQQRIVQTVLDGMHARFKTVVATGRPGMDPARLEALADGRILGADDALAAGLVDRIGRLHDALDVARQAAGLKQARIVEYAAPGGESSGVYAAAGLGLFGTWGGLPVSAGLSAVAGLDAVPMYVWAQGLGAHGLGARGLEVP